MSKNHSKPQVYSYVRFSNREQRHGTSKVRQDKAAEEWCRKRGLRLAEVYPDLGVSAFKGKNATTGALSRLLACVEDGSIRPGSILLVESLDRLSRDDVNKALPIFLQIVNGGIKVCTLIDGNEYVAGDPQMTLKMFSSLIVFSRANDESRTKSERKRAAWAENRKAALQGKALLAGKRPKWIEVVDGKYRVVKSEAERVRAVLRDYASGMGVGAVHLKHNVSKPTIRSWIEKKLVVGTVTVRDGGTRVEIPDHYPAIVDSGLWKRVQARKAEMYRAPTPPGRIGFVNLFSGILRDAHGEAFRVIRHRKTISHGQQKREQQYSGFSLYESARMKCVIRCRAMELGIIVMKLAGKMTRRIIIDDDTPSPELAAIDAKLAKLKAATLKGKVTIENTIELIEGFQEQRREIEAKQDRRTIEKLDSSVFDGLLAAPWTDDVKLDAETHAKVRADRLWMREVIRQNVREIKVTKVECIGWDHYIGGKIDMTDGRVVGFGFAYCSRRRGIIHCNGERKWWTRDDRQRLENIGDIEPPDFVEATGLTHKLRAALRYLPLTYTRKQNEAPAKVGAK